MVISPLMWVVTIATLLLTPLISTHEPPSTTVLGSGCFGLGFRGLKPMQGPKFRILPKGLDTVQKA